MISKVNDLENILHHEKVQIGVVQWYELLASVAYWHKRGYEEKDLLISKIGETKPQFSKDQVHVAYNAYLSFLQQS